jgi:DNA-binding response OmpR family regulator
MSACPILIVDDNVVFNAMLTEQLSQKGEFQVVEAHSVFEAKKKVQDHEARFGAIILDVGLPDGDGCELCSQFRQDGLKMPILMLTGSDSEDDVVRGLNVGANDYVAKPFRPAELVARLRAQIRIFESSEDVTFDIGPYNFRPSTKTLREIGSKRRIRLTNKESEILKFLYRAGNQSVARQKLLNEIWGYNSTITTHTLETHIYRLRQKMEADPSEAHLLLTENGGYRLNTSQTSS